MTFCIQMVSDEVRQNCHVRWNNSYRNCCVSLRRSKDGKKTVVAYETTKIRAIFALLGGAILGGIFVSADYLWSVYEIHGMDYTLTYGPSNGFGVFVVAFLVWGTGILVLGTPIWYLLHGRRIRQFWAAVIVGGVLVFVTNFAFSTRMFTGQASGEYSLYAQGDQQWEKGHLTLFGWQTAAQSALYMALFGCLVAALIWRLAYRRSPR